MPGFIKTTSLPGTSSIIIFSIKKQQQNITARKNNDTFFPKCYIQDDIILCLLTFRIKFNFMKNLIFLYDLIKISFNFQKYISLFVNLQKASYQSFFIKYVITDFIINCYLKCFISLIIESPHSQGAVIWVTILITIIILLLLF